MVETHGEGQHHVGTRVEAACRPNQHHFAHPRGGQPGVLQQPNDGHPGMLPLAEEDAITLYKALPHRCMVQLMFGEMDESERGRAYALYTLEILGNTLVNLDRVYPVGS